MSLSDNKLKCVSTDTVSKRNGENFISVISELLTIENFIVVNETRISRG